MSHCSDQFSNSNHLSFHCVSGELVWGQLHCICEGYFNRRHDRYDNPQSIPKIGQRGTIKQRSYQYRCRAAKGDWQAKPYDTRLDVLSEPYHSGYIIYNNDHNPVEILRRCAVVGSSLDQTHNDRSIIFINRYDWADHHDYNFRTKINRLLGIRKNIDDKDYSYEPFFRGRIMIIDSDSAMNIIQQWKSNPTEFAVPSEKVFTEMRNESNHRVGLHLSMPNLEYEFAWLVFSNDQPDAELIGLVYDGSYTMLDGQVILDQEDIVSWDEYQSKRQELHRRNEELWKKYQVEIEAQNDADIRAIMNHRGNKTVNQLAHELLAQGFTFGDSAELVAKYSEEYNDFQSIVDMVQKK